jgi:hypothetical protein
MSLFEVYRDKLGLMCTDEVSCIYDRATLESMVKSGHKLKLNGKAATVAAICEYVKQHEQPEAKKKKSKKE